MIVSSNTIERAAKAMHRTRWPESQWEGRRTNRAYWRREARKALEKYAIAADPDPKILQALADRGRVET